MIRNSFIFLIVISFLAGCGQSQDADRNDHDGQGEGSGGIVAGEIETSIDYKQEGGAAHFQFHLKNQTEHVKTYHFNTGQRYDYVIKNEQGETIKQFSEGSMFTQVLGEETLKQGESLTYKSKVSDLPAGAYMIEFWLTAKKERPKASLTFTVD